MITFACQHGILTARAPSTHPSLPGRLLASAMDGTDGWFVSTPRGGRAHLIYVVSEADARTVLTAVAEVLA